jgi:hypothetical protein
MGLLGSAAVAIWNDILPEEKSSFIEWHNREHIPERVAITGFRRGRRYFGADARPQYFTLYEADDEAVLTSEAYLSRLNNPTPRTRAVVPAFRNTSRGVCRVALSLGCGDGGFMATLRFGAAADQAALLERHLVTAALPPLSDIDGVSGVHLCIVDQKASGIETSERKGRHVDVPRWVVLLEGSDPSAVNGACDELVARGIERHGGVGPFVRGLYALEISCAKSSRSRARAEAEDRDAQLARGQAPSWAAGLT